MVNKEVGGIRVQYGKDCIYIRYACLDDFSDLVKIERGAWIPGMQASRKTLKKRLEKFPKGNLIAFYNEEPAGILNSRIGNISEKIFVEDGFRIFSDMERHDPVGKDLFIFNVGVVTKYRNRGVGSALVLFAEYTSLRIGPKEAYLDSRCPSYKGSTKYPQEHVAHRHKVQETIDSGILDEKLLSRDPRQRFYQKLNYKIFRLAKDYVALDETCPHRIIRYKKLYEIENPLVKHQL